MVTGLGRWRLLALGLAMTANSLRAEPPYTPRNDMVVVETVRQPRLPGMASLGELRARWAAQPTLVPAALAYARAAAELSRRDEDPRYLGYAQAALAPWWDRPDTPPEVLLLRASLHLARMDYAPAERDLQALIGADVPEGHAARITRALLRLSQGDPVAAAADCAAAAAHVSALTAASCKAAVQGLQGASADALYALETALQRSADAPWSVELWARSVAAELALRIGQTTRAQRHFDAGLSRMRAAGSTDPGILAAYADFLLHQGEAQQVRDLLAPYLRQDSLLLRLTLAELSVARHGDAAAGASATQHTRHLALRFAEMRQRGDRSHLSDQARFELDVRSDPSAALARMTESWTYQRDPVDARLLLRAARAARQPEAAAAVDTWIASTGVRDQRLAAEQAASRQPASGR